MRWRRRDLLALPAALAQAQPAPTRFQLACMTLPYSAFSFERALIGIHLAGYSYVAWGVQHEGKPVLPVDAAPAEAARLARHCQDVGLTPVMMFATVNLEDVRAVDAHRRRIAQAQAAGIPFLLTFGKTGKGEQERFLQNLKAVAPFAEQRGVTVLIKQHGGNTATGQDCAHMVRAVGSASVRICYDAGNVLDYENQDPIADIATCVPDIRAFAIKDHRNFPKDEDCGPGFGEIDHYKLLRPVMNTGLTMPLACENIFEPLRPRPTQPDGVDQLARRAREFLESVLGGLRAVV